MTEAKRTLAGYVPEQDIRLSENRHGVEKVERTRSGKVALPDVSREAAMLAPLDIEAEIAHFGAETRGGVGVSTPALA